MIYRRLNVLGRTHETQDHCPWVRLHGVGRHANSEMSEIPFHGEIGPPLDGAGERWSEAQLRGMLVNAKNMFPGTMMPAFYKVDGFTRPGDDYTGTAAPADLDPILTAQQIEDVVAYLS